LKPGEELAIPAYNLPYPSRLSCASYQPESDTVLVTGGRDPTMTRGLQYSNTGPTNVEYPDLQIGRYNHGCTSYSSDSKTFYIVTGEQKNQVDLLDITEIYDPEANAWTIPEPVSATFPVRVAGLRMVNIMDNRVLAFGGVEEKEGGDKFLSSIFQWDIAEQTWGNNELTVKNMTNKRSRFGISVVNIEAHEKNCHWSRPN
jgi:N-acetylneuraminic acid mutarotase